MSSVLRRLSWPAVVVGIAALAVGDAFSLDRAFYLRDLATYFWPHHLWLRRTVWSGNLPLWAPEPGLGYATIADPNLQLLFPLTIAARILLPDVIGFNLMVALPVPLAALGAFCFLRRRFTAPAAAAGALVFALSGPFLSTVSAPNLSASTALVPWVLWAIDRFAERSSFRRGAALAVVVAVQALAGEPLTLVTAGAIGFCFALAVARDAGDGGRRPSRVAAGVLGWAAVGMLLTAAQVLPSADAAARSPRGAGLLVDGWSVHPLSLLEAVAPALFGGPADAVSAWSPWLFPLNAGREPFLGSLYVGVGVLALAMLGAARGDRSRWGWFWTATLLVALVLALGYFTPVYPWLRSSVPGLSWMRYPAKFAVFVAVALGCLVAAGADALGARASGGARALPVCVGLAGAAAGLLMLVPVLAEPGATAAGLEALARRTGLADAAGGAAYLADSIRIAGPRLIGIGAASAVLFWAVGRGARVARAARFILLGAIVVDLLAANHSLNPTVPAAWLGEPSWVAATRSHPGDRVYSGQAAILPAGDRELPGAIAVRADTPAPAVTALLSTQLGTFPMAWGVRSALTPDLTQLRPTAYRVLIERFAASDPEARRRFLRRVGTRYHLALEAPPGSGPRLGSLAPLIPMSLFEDPQPGPRASVVTAARIVPDLRERIAALFAPPPPPGAEVLLAGPPPAPAGVPGEPAIPEARITAESPTTMRITAAVPRGGGYLVVADAYDPNWRAAVDGAAAPLLEADGLFRAVHLAAGRHEVTLRYGSRPLGQGVVVSVATAILLLAGCLFWPCRAAVSSAAPPTTAQEER